MKTYLLPLLLLFFVGISACEDELTPTFEEDTETIEEDAETFEEAIAYLDEKLEEIIDLSESETCTNANNWSFVAYGAKACGGPIGYIAYSNDIDVNYFLDLVSTYSEEQDAFNILWGIISTCDIEPEPSDVDCVNGEAVLVY